MARHLEDMHSDEIEVAKITSIIVKVSDSREVKNAKLKQRKRMFEKLRKRGNFNHNMLVLREKKGLLVVEKRPNKPQPYTNYLPCEHCFGFYIKKELRKHIRTCVERSEGVTVGKRVQSAASMLLCFEESASADLRAIFAKMNPYDAGRVAKSDKTIIQFGNRLCRKLRKEGDQQYYISNKVRELARLVLETRKCCADVESLKDCLMPKNFDYVIEAFVHQTIF